MNISKKHNTIFLILCTALMIISFPVSVHAEQSDVKTVRVGWYEDSYHMEGKMEKKEDMVMNMNRWYRHTQAGSMNM